jgi:hypothetical protein
MHSIGSPQRIQFFLALQYDHKSKETLISCFSEGQTMDLSVQAWVGSENNVSEWMAFSSGNNSKIGGRWPRDPFAGGLVAHQPQEQIIWCFT